MIRKARKTGKTATGMRFAAGLIAALVVLAVFLTTAEAEMSAQSKPGALTVYLFWGNGCPHCEEEMLFLEKLQAEYPDLAVKKYEVWYNRENAELLSHVMQSARAKNAGVPATIIGKKLFLGFSPETGKSITEAVRVCRKQGCPDALQAMLSGTAEPEAGKKTRLPVFGDVDTSTVSLPLLTIVIGGLDSFNPCAFFVLLFLLSMLIHTRSRKKMMLIGGVFIFFSGLIYFLFMAAWLNLFLVIGRLAAVTAAAGLVALTVAAINIKDFFFFRKGVSLVIPEQAKPKLFERMRNMLKSSSLAAMLGGTVVLAVSANAYELLCTAGFPMVYTRALTLHNLTPLQYYLYLALYNVVYVIPLAVIVTVITVTLGSRKLTEWQGRQLKLISGLMMLFLGVILLVDPALLNNAAASGLLLAAVIVLSAITIYAAKRLKPEIATE